MVAIGDQPSADLRPPKITVTRPSAERWCVEVVVGIQTDTICGPTAEDAFAKAGAWIDHMSNTRGEPESAG